MLPSVSSSVLVEVRMLCATAFFFFFREDVNANMSEQHVNTSMCLRLRLSLPVARL